MKKIFTSLSLALCAMAMFAWEKPVITAEQYLPMTPGDSVYIYNTGSSLFLTEGNEWGTHASVGEEGLLITIEKCLTGDEWDGKTYYIKDFSLTKNSWKTMFIDDNVGNIYVDLGSQANYYWEFEARDGNTFRFFGADVNPDWNHSYEFFAGAYVGHATAYMNNQSGETTGTGVIFDVPENYGEGKEKSGNFYCDWTAISQADYAVYVAKVKAYNAALALAAKIDEAKAKGVDASAAQAVYDNAASTAEELNDAIAALNQAIMDAEAGNASPDNPANMTNLIINPDFTGGDCTTGWSGDAFGRGGTVADGAEMYNKTFNAYQDIKGAPAGIYRVGVQAFYRAGAASGDYQNFINDDLGTRHAKLYAVNGDEVEVNVGIVHLASGAESENLSGGDELTCADNLYVSNTMAAADYHFNTLDKYHNYLLCEVTADGTLRIGAKKSVQLDSDWTLFDNFTLDFYGNSDAAYKMWLESVLAEAPTFDFDELICTKALAEAYEAVLAEAAAADTKDAIKAAIAKINPAAEALSTNVAAWNKYIERVAALRAELEETEYICDEGYTLIDYVMDGNVMEPSDEMPNGSYDYICSEGILDTEGIAAELAWLDLLYQAAVANSLQPGQDCTNLLVNPGFSYSDGRGWQNPNGVTMTGGLSTYPCAEAYEKAFDVYQIVNDLPKGIYMVTANCFYRPGANGTYDGTEEIPAEIYFNEFATPVQHILSETSETELFNDGSWMADYQTSTGGFVPNSMNGASTYFLAGMYLQQVYGLVEDGTMRLGIRSTATTGAGRWCLWTNFKLFYVGKDETALTEILPVYQEKAQVLLDEDQPMNAKVKAALLDAIDASIIASDADSMFDALTNLNAAIAAARASISVYATLTEATADLLTAIEWYSAASDAAIVAALKLYEEVSNGLTKGAYDDDEVAAKLDAIGAAKAALRIPAVEPTDDEPADFTDWIVNPAFDDGNADGWTITIVDKTNFGYQSAGYDGNASISQFIEVWRSGNTALGDGDICQTIKYLPEGTYSLACDLIANHQGGNETVGVQLFEEEEDGTLNALDVATGNGLPEHFEVIFRKQANTDVTIGLRITSTTANWVAADNWTLQYYGKKSSLLPTDVDLIQTPEPAIVVIYDLQGRRLDSLQRGINIVNGKKIIVR